MKVSNQYNSLAFNSRCPEIKLGQDICHKVNCEFPHYSMTKFQPIIDKHIRKTKKPWKIMQIISKLGDDRPSPSEAEYYNYYKYYFLDLFNYIKKHHAFNCHESGLLSALMLKLNGVQNVYTASIHKGSSEIDHVVCFFNRDGSEYDGKIKNNQTIIVDPWTGICDFAGKVFKEYSGFWSEHLKPIIMPDGYDGKYGITKIKSMDLPKEFLNSVKENYPELKL